MTYNYHENPAAKYLLSEVISPITATAATVSCHIVELRFCQVIDLVDDRRLLAVVDSEEEELLVFACWPPASQEQEHYLQPTQKDGTTSAADSLVLSGVSQNMAFDHHLVTMYIA